MENSASSMSISTEDLNKDITSSKSWRILTYGLNESHLDLLSGILGKEIPSASINKSSYSFTRNLVSVEVHFGPNTASKISYEDVDLLIYFIPIEEDIVKDQIKVLQDISKITADHSEMIWKHSVVVFSGMEDSAAGFRKRDNVNARFETFLETWTKLIQGVIKSALKNFDGVAANEVLIRPAGSLSAPDLPKPHEKWFSLLWHGCFLSSKVDSLPAILKISQDRLKYDISTKEVKDVPFHEQPISVYQGFYDRTKYTLGLTGYTSAAIGTGGTIGALIGALAIGVPTFGVAAGTGLVVGGVVGAGIAGAAVTSGMKIADKSDTKDGMNSSASETRSSKQMLLYAQMVINFPKVACDLKYWASKQTTCKIVVTGKSGEGVSTAAAALTGVSAKGDICKVQVSTKSNVEVYDCKGFQGDFKAMNPKAKEVIYFQNKKDLLVFCIPMTSTIQDFVYSFHRRFLEQLFTEDANIFSKTVIALTHANQLQGIYNSQSGKTFKQFFEERLQSWKKEIKLLLERGILLSTKVAESVPVVVVGGSDQPTIKLSESEEYHWQSKFYLEVLSQTQNNGLPVSIKANRKRIATQGDGYFDRGHALQVLIDTQCLMFSSKGKEQFEELSGEAIGLIMGVNEIQDW